MTSVHGISLAGGTFPATIWHQFMSAALWHSPPLDFPEPKHFPVYVGWHGQWAYAGGGYDSQSSSASPGYTTTGVPPATTTRAAPVTTLAPVTTAPVTQPPPPATTEPPPPVPGNP